MCIFEAFGLGRDSSGDIIPLSLPSMLFFAVTENEPICLTLFLCETDTRLVFMLEFSGKESVK
jgi:hypothetical protein